MKNDPRSYFPRGLTQPSTGFRFSTDSLLLACFASVPPQGRILDLGTGCGVIPLGVLLRHPENRLAATGIDVNPEMIAAAQANTALLDFSAELEILAVDVRTPDFAPAESYDLVLSNPPYRNENVGRACPDKSKNKARFEVDCDLDAFTATAARMIRNRGRVAFVFLAERVTELLDSFTRHRLEPKRIKFIHGRVGAPAKVVMVEAVKNGKPGLIVEPPVILYGDGQELLASAVKYCPFIAKSAVG
ncbi:methyltransferase [Maridesulfovibrio sp.]|uniref:tRNA1(Val) (adenine(37)-N6)-methyltransferase n=1 Tax=Maridesulfovibrio sp. TaxID=2795000 RepID=UPI002A188FA8|nr:methyltransferase [Maridesulfovibrio sp.]